MDNKNRKEESVINIIVVVFTIIIIFTLAFLFYYFATKSQTISDLINLVEINTENSTAGLSSAIEKSTIIDFERPDIIAENTQSGECGKASLISLYRNSVFKCTVEDKIYDPCFTTNYNSVIYCPINPEQNSFILVNLINSLSEVESVAKENKNWAWFLKLYDKTYCSLSIEEDLIVDGNLVYYDCGLNELGQKVVLLGDLISGNLWKANRAVLEQNDELWTVKSIEMVSIDTVWQ